MNYKSSLFSRACVRPYKIIMAFAFTAHESYRTHIIPWVYSYFTLVLLSKLENSAEEFMIITLPVLTKQLE